MVLILALVLSLVGAGVAAAQDTPNPPTAQHMVCDSGCGSPPASADGTSFTAGTTNVSLIGAAFNDALLALTAGTYAAPRITAYRALHINLRDSSGAELGTPGSPLNTACVSGCAAGAVGQGVMATSAPVVIASNQSAVATTNAVLTDVWNSVTHVLTTRDNVLSNAYDGVNQRLIVDGSQVTQPVSGTFWPATQPVSGTFWQVTQPVSIATMPSTPVTGTFWQATQPVSGTFWQATQPVSIATMPSTPVTGTFFQATQPVSLATLPALVAGTAVIGHVINDASTAVIGHVIADTGSTTAVTGTVSTVTDPTTAATEALSSGAKATVTTAVNVKASAGNVYGFSVLNGAGVGCWMELINSATAGTLGTGVILNIALPASGVVNFQPGNFAIGNFAAGIAVGVASAIGGASACGTAATGITVFYK